MIKRQDRYWSEEYSSYVSSAFADVRTEKQQISIRLEDCVIELNENAFFYLKLHGKEIKKLTIDQVIKYRDYVKEVLL